MEYFYIMGSRRHGLIFILIFSPRRFEITVVTGAHFCMSGHSNVSNV